MSMLDEEESTTDTASRRAMDPELRVMGQVLRALEELPAEARPRVIVYLSQRFPEAVVRTHQ